MWLSPLPLWTSSKHGDLCSPWSQTQGSNRVPYSGLCTFRKAELGRDIELNWYWQITSQLEVNVNMTELVISWLVDCQHSCLLRDQFCMETQSVELVMQTFITTHLPPSPRLDIQDPCILQSVFIIIHPSSDQQLGVLLSIVETTGSMGWSLHWPRSSLRFLQFGPLLGQVPQ